MVSPPTDRPRVDVGVVTWNTAELTAGALGHLLHADQGCDLRVLVHDNGSSDGTPEVLARAVPEAEVEVSSRNLGFARAVNRLLRRSDAPWFLALNSDAWPEPGALRVLVAAAERHPRAAAAVPLLRRPDGGVEHSTHPFPSLGVAALDALGGRRWLPGAVLDARCLQGGWHHDRPRRVDWAVGAALLLRREAVEDVGPLDERFFMYVEDLQWCWRARQRGWEIRFEPGAVVRHVGNASGARRWGDRRVGLEAAYLRVFLREALGPRRAAAYRGLQALAGAERMVLARRRGRTGEAAHWRLLTKAQLGLVAAPPVDTDEPVDVGDLSGGGDGPAGQPPVPGGRPRVAVAVPTHGRARRLGRLVAALEAQTLPHDQFEVLVVDDASPDGTPEILRQLAASTPLRLRVLANPVRRGPAAARNLAWRSSAAPVVAFTDDDCVPDPDWLRAGLAALDGQARVVVGRTAPPADQLPLATAPFSRTMAVDSARFFETCNVFYRRRDLEAAGGFDERFRRPSGEDTHLGLAVTARGVEPVFARDALVLHDVRPGSLAGALRETLRWVDLPLVLRGRPEARPALVHRLVFWKPTHPPATVAAAGLLLALRWRPALVLVVPWLVHRLRTSPPCADPAGRVLALPGALAVDLCEVGVMVRGSLRHRTVLL